MNKKQGLFNNFQFKFSTIVVLVNIIDIKKIHTLLLKCQIFVMSEKIDTIIYPIGKISDFSRSTITIRKVSICKISICKNPVQYQTRISKDWKVKVHM